MASLLWTYPVLPVLSVPMGELLLGFPAFVCAGECLGGNGCAVPRYSEAASCGGATERSESSSVLATRGHGSNLHQREWHHGMACADHGGAAGKTSVASRWGLFCWSRLCCALIPDRLPVTVPARVPL